MGMLGKDGSNPLIFDGRPESWPLFKKPMHQFLDKEGLRVTIRACSVLDPPLLPLEVQIRTSSRRTGKFMLESAVHGRLTLLY
jgi:hypothetical protein